MKDKALVEKGQWPGVAWKKSYAEYEAKYDAWKKEHHKENLHANFATYRQGQGKAGKENCVVQ